MAATFAWQENYGAGPTLWTPTHFNWLNSADPENDAYGDYPITPGEHSYERWIFGKFSGSFSEIRGGLFAHTATAFNAYETLRGPFCMWSVADPMDASGIFGDYGLIYRTPVKTHALSSSVVPCRWNMTPVDSITDINKDHTGDPARDTPSDTGSMVVYFGATTPDGDTLKRAWSSAGTAYTNYLTTQLTIDASHSGGDTATVTLTLQYEEV